MLSKERIIRPPPPPLLADAKYVFHSAESLHLLAYVIDHSAHCRFQGNHLVLIWTDVVLVACLATGHSLLLLFTVICFRLF